MSIEFSNKKEVVSPEQIAEAEKLLLELDQAAERLGVKLEDSSWFSPIKKGDLKAEANQLAITEMIKGISYGLLAALGTLAVTGSERGAWIMGSLVGVEKLIKALRYMNNELQLGDLKKMVELAKQKMATKTKEKLA